MAIEPALYRPLDPARKEIRILQLEDGSSRHHEDGIGSTILSFRVGTISLTDRIAPFYDAISYSWGTDEEKKQRANILLNGRKVSVQATAEAALRALCKQHGHYRVWIDAVCIDLASKNECNDQVAMMGDIFSKANRVVVWYGNDEFLGEPPIGSLPRLLEVLDPTISDRLKTPHSKSSKSPPLRTDPRILAQFPGWSSLYAFFSNRWFTRAWVIQEVCLGKHVLCYQGHIAVDFNDIAKIATYVWERRHNLPKIPKKNAITGVENAAMIWTLKRHKAQKLASLLRVVYTFNCQIPHDMVYSILGLRHKAAQAPESTTRIIPIYEEPVLEVFAKATKAAIAETNSLGLLKHAHSLRTVSTTNGKIDDFPTWALRMDLRGHYHINPISYRAFRFNADDGQPLDLWRGDSSRVLRVQGVLFDRVHDASKPMVWKTRGTEAKAADTLTAAAVLHETFSWCRETIPAIPNEILARKFSITVAAGQDSTGRKLANAKEHADRLYFGFMNAAYAPSHAPTDDEGTDNDDVMSVRSTSSTATSRSIDVTDFDTDLAADNPDATYALSAMMKSGHHRTTFVTQRGVLGLGTDNIQPGDAICILFGGSVPLVLRQENHFWRFVGDAYIDEIMEGGHIRALKATDNLERESQWFKIR